MWVKKAATAAALVLAVMGAVPGVAIADPTDAPAPTPAPDAAGPTAPPTPSVSPTPGPAPATAGPKTSVDADGTYAVGTDVAPGVYTSAGPVGDGTCFWKRLGPDGATVDNALTKKPQTVTIDPTDKSFKTNGCQPWQLSDQPAPPQASGLGPVVAGLQLQAYMAQLNARAAASGQAPPP
ncbi:hypothetical protein H7K45_21995 [Mycobacterium yunnanensis]|uniref:Lipoprotein n=2 Tax=Mycobacterium yunnanensis TaxID=368477 RepID=A0A9X2Z848_9MYCO|nr:hypothetical protein [Mycobacterium yunnanensis]MCV7423227.1 hypothetical protein [Mycobacterium yunnanensis]